MIAAWVADRPQSEVLRIWDEHGVAGCPIYDVRDIIADEHVTAREMLVEVDDDELGPLRLPV